MIAASLPEGDGLVDLLLRKEADVNVKSKAFESTAARYNIVAQALIVMWRSDFQGQVSNVSVLLSIRKAHTPRRQHCTSAPRRTTLMLLENS